MSGETAKRVTWIDEAMFDELTVAALGVPRLRRNRNFHGDDAAPAHRLLNAIEPGSYVAPHRHLDPAKDETILVLRGRLGVIVFTDAGEIADTAVLAAGGPRVGIDIPHGVYHALAALDPGCIMFEAKAGPYLPLTAAEKAAWAPGEGEPAAAAFLDGLRRLFD